MTMEGMKKREISRRALRTEHERERVENVHEPRKIGIEKGLSRKNILRENGHQLVT